MRAKNRRTRSSAWGGNPTSAREPAAVAPSYRPVSGNGALIQRDENARLYDFDSRTKAAFDAIVPALKQIAAVQHEANFDAIAQQIAQTELGFRLPEELLADAWINHLDIKRLYAWCVFEAYRRFSTQRMSAPVSAVADQTDFQSWIESCGFHIVDVTPCADGRLAHVIRYVLRMPPEQVRRKSFAGSLFDVEDSVAKWTEVEFGRFQHSTPNDITEATRYLKVVVYHYSSVDPHHEGCAAHGSDTEKAAAAGLGRLQGFKEYVENSYCCGASIDILLLGLDTDTDEIRAHVPNAQGEIDLTTYLGSKELRNEVSAQSADQAQQALEQQIVSRCSATEGMAKFVAGLMINNFSQMSLVEEYYHGSYPDVGHAERFIGIGKGFEEVQMRNLTYFAYLDTVEEATRDVDVGIKIFTKLNINKGLPAPVIVRFDYDGSVPGARDSAIERCQRVAQAVHQRFPALSDDGLLHTLQLIKNQTQGAEVETISSSLDTRI